MTTKVKLNPPNNGTPLKRRWHQSPLVRGTVLALALSAGTIFGARGCKGCNPEPKPAPCEEVCPKDWKREDVKGDEIKVIKCIAPKKPAPEPRCGDGACNGKETAKSCPKDCPPVCGDGEITHKEKCDTKSTEKNNGCKDEKTECKDVRGSCECVEKKKVPEHKVECGDGKCEEPENAKTCPQDCPPVCGDGYVTHNEECEKAPKPGETKKCEEGQACKRCKCEDDSPPPPPPPPPAGCTRGNADGNITGGVPFSLRQKAKEGVLRHRAQLSGLETTPKVTYLICPIVPNRPGVYAKVLSVDGAGSLNSVVEASVRSTLDNAKAMEMSLDKPKIYVQNVSVK